MNTIQRHWATGRRIYGKRRWRETRRVVLFTVRAMIHTTLYNRLHDYVAAYTPYPYMLDEHIDMLDVIGRVVLFKNSTASERYQAWVDHFDLLQKYLTAEQIYQLYHKVDYPDPELASPGIVFYENPDMELVLRLAFCKGQRKEGFLTLLIEYKGEKLYNTNIRFGKGFEGEDAIIVGTIQGKPNGLEDTKKVTKMLFGYRPKNLSLYMARLMAEILGIRTLYAVSDEGFYANSHLLRIHRSKSVFFDDFWKENGGVVCTEDSRFFRIPIEEERKTYETAKTHKRNMYRKRYELLDTIKESMTMALHQ